MGLLAYLRNTNRNLKVKTSNKTTKLFKIVKPMQVRVEVDVTITKLNTKY